MIKFKTAAAEAIHAALAQLMKDGAPPSGELEDMLEYPPDRSMGDIAFPCFRLSRTMRKAPPVIAGEIRDALALPQCFSEITAAGGYLNFRIDPVALSSDTVSEIIASGDDYGKNRSGEGRTLVIDYSSPNVAKPFHIGHLGTTVIGHSLKMLYAFSGWNCIGINHLGDWGTQFGKLIVAYRRWGNEEEVKAGGVDALVALYVRFHREAEEDPALNDLARAEFTKLEHHDPDNIKLWKWFISISIEEYEKTYRQLGITFDHYTGESFYTDLMPAQVEKLREKKLLTIDDGASIVDLSKWNMPPCLILKRDGSTLYPTRDIAAAVYRKETYNFDRCIYVTSNQQILHFRQWFKVVELMGYDWYDELVHIPYGTVSINGEKLSTRSGNVVLLKDLFAMAIEKVGKIIEEKNPSLENKDEVAEAVGVGAVVFYYLTNSRIKDINFVLEDALNFDGNTGPYAQYTYARTCSIISKAGGVPDVTLDASSFTDASEIELAKTLSIFPEKVLAAIADYEPSVITRYILDVCAAFNHFYHECQIVTAPDPKVRDLRVALTAAVKNVLGAAFGLICMKKTEKI